MPKRDADFAYTLAQFEKQSTSVYEIAKSSLLDEDEFVTGSRLREQLLMLKDGEGMFSEFEEKVRDNVLVDLIIELLANGADPLDISHDSAMFDSEFLTKTTSHVHLFYTVSESQEILVYRYDVTHLNRRIVQLKTLIGSDDILVRDFALLMLQRYLGMALSLEAHLVTSDWHAVYIFNEELNINREKWEYLLGAGVTQFGVTSILRHFKALFESISEKPSEREYIWLARKYVMAYEALLSRKEPWKWLGSELNILFSTRSELLENPYFGKIVLEEIRKKVSQRLQDREE